MDQQQPSRDVAAILWFMSRISSFRELLATGINEYRALVDTMVSAAPPANPPVRVPPIEAMKPSERTTRISEKLKCEFSSPLLLGLSALPSLRNRLPQAIVVLYPNARPDQLPALPIRPRCVKAKPSGDFKP